VLTQLYKKLGAITRFLLNVPCTWVEQEGPTMSYGQVGITRRDTQNYCLGFVWLKHSLRTDRKQL